MLRPLRPKLVALMEHSHSNRCFQKQMEEWQLLPSFHFLISYPFSSRPRNRFVDSSPLMIEQGTNHEGLRDTGEKVEQELTIGHVHQGLLCERQSIKWRTRPCLQDHTAQFERGGLPT